MVNYKEIKKKDIQSQLSEAQLLVSDLLMSDKWKKYENSVYYEGSEIEKIEAVGAKSEKELDKFRKYNVKKGFILQLKELADNRFSFEQCFKNIPNVHSLIERVSFPELGIENSLKKELLSTLNAYIGILHFIESSRYSLKKH